jgi:hypothetical protein
LPSIRNRSLTVFPNPASQIINIQAATENPFDFSDVSYTLCDGIGRGLVSRIGGASLDIMDIAPGLYFLRIESLRQGILETHKIVISR